MKKPCNSPGCPVLLDKGIYCQKHKATAPKRHTIYDRHVRRKDPALAIAARIRSSPRWQLVRRQVIADNPLCADPFGIHQRQSVTRTSTQVHHIEGVATHPELAFVASNLQSVCSSCHARLERECRSAAKDLPAPSSTQPETNGPAFG